MSLLPQQKKSAEEIARLRESLGIPGHAAGEGDSPAVDPQLERVPDVLETNGYAHPKQMDHSSGSQLAPLPLAAPHTAKPVRSFKRDERIPVLPVVEIAEQEYPPEENPGPVVLRQEPKPVRSLRKSEQVPLDPVSPPPPDSTLPFHRHSDSELQEIRRQEAIAMLATQAHPRSLTAHKVLVIPGYLFALAGAICYYYYQLDIQFTAACVFISLLFAAFIFIKKPLSRHHAAFISVTALLVIVFGTLHYFPNLQYGS